MSRVGNKIINVPEGVKVEIAADNTVTVTGAKGTLVRQFSPLININMDENTITVSRTSERYNKSFTCQYDRRCTQRL